MAAEPSLAIVGAGVTQSEDAPFVPANYEFLPGDYLYFTFQVAGFAIRSENRDETRSISLTYEVVPEDANGLPLTAPATGAIKAELSSEDKDWLPKRRASFLIPSFVAGREFRVHVHVRDLVANTEIAQDFPFRIGGIQIQRSASLTVENFDFFRSENDQQPLEVPAYSRGDTIYARFDMVGFKTDPQKQYHLSYGLTVVRPDGKTFLDTAKAAELEASSFYPAEFLPGVVNLKTPPDAMLGEYIVVLTVRDLIGNTSSKIKKAFSIE